MSRFSHSLSKPLIKKMLAAHNKEREFFPSEHDHRAIGALRTNGTAFVLNFYYGCSGHGTSQTFLTKDNKLKDKATNAESAAYKAYCVFLENTDNDCIIQLKEFIAAGLFNYASFSLDFYPDWLSRSVQTFARLRALMTLNKAQLLSQ